jgi:uncharacterized protein (TIGR03382 family)
MTAGGGEGTPCTNDLECLSLFCADPGDGNRRCLTPCRGDDGTCFAGEVCVAAPGGCGGCVEEHIVVGARGLGEGCDDDGDCRSRACHEEVPGLSYCTRACTEDLDCGSADRFHCRDEICIRGAVGAIGDSCVFNGDCFSGTFCAARAGVRWCTTFCSEDQPCPEGFECIDVPDASLCVPSRGVVGDACTADDGCITGVCDVDGGVCTRNCSPESPCSGAFECRLTEDGTEARCVAPFVPPVPELGGGGCSVSRAGHPNDASTGAPHFVALFGAFAFAARRRRRRINFGRRGGG